MEATTQNDNAAAPQQVPEEKPIRYLEKEVRHELSEETCASYGRKVGALHDQKRQLEEKKKSVVKTMDGELKQLDIQIAALMDSLNHGAELRLTRCYERWENGMIALRDQITNQLYDTRPPTHADRQTSITNAEPGKAPVAERGGDHIPGIDDVPKENGHALDGPADGSVDGMTTSTVGDTVYVAPDDEGPGTSDYDRDDEGTETPVLTPPGGAPQLDDDAFPDDDGLTVARDDEAEEETKDERPAKKKAAKPKTSAKPKRKR